jgi:catechol 2,3-dioxygenase-like lactoylglutathione lyase family enzyme
MQQSILHTAVVVRDYDEAIAFFCGKLHFELVEDTYQPEQDKRWVLVAPPRIDWRFDSSGSRLESRAGSVQRSSDWRPNLPVSWHGRFLEGLQ